MPVNPDRHEGPVKLSSSAQEFRFDLRSDIVAPASTDVATAIVEATLRRGEFEWRHDAVEQALEARVCEILGKPAAALFPTCTAANIAGLIAMGARERILVLDRISHLNTNEMAGLRLLAEPRLVLFDRNGDEPIWPDNLDEPGAILCLENTHNRRGGTVLNARDTQRLARYARDRGWAVFLDGSRLWNASVASGDAPATLAAPADLVSVSFNKGLGAPNGAALAGGEEAVAAAADVWRRLGGICRPSHVLAAGALAVLADIERLREDHDLARETAQAIARLDGFAPSLPQTNIVLISGEDLGFDAATLSASLGRSGLGCLAFGPRHVRLVFHRGIPAGSAPQIADIFRNVSREAGRTPGSTSTCR